MHLYYEHCCIMLLILWFKLVTVVLIPYVFVLLLVLIRIIHVRMTALHLFDMLAFIVLHLWSDDEKWL